MNYFTPEKRNVSKPMSEQMQKLAARYEKATGKNESLTLDAASGAAERRMTDNG